jgi:hypothetical protein
MSIAQNFPNLKPSLLLDFSNTEALDSRVTFTRASTARVYDGKTVAKAEENLLLRSQEFNSGWTYDSVSSTANTTVAPDGTTTADTLSFADTAVSRGYQAFTGNGSAFTFSVFAKYIDKQWIAFRLNDSGGTNRFVWFDVQNGVVGTTQAGITASIVASTEGFYRCIATIATTATSNFAMIQGVNGDNSTSNVGQTGSVAAWGAQLEQRSAVTAYTPTTTQPITNYIPVLQTAAAGVARFDHNPITGESLGLLIEEQRTNLLTYSDDLSNAAWTKTRSSITANTIVAPDGTLTGDKLVEDTTATSSHVLIRSSTSFTSGTVYTISAYVKAAERTSLRLLFGTGFSAQPAAFFNISTGVISANPSGNSSSASIAPVGNGWYRVSITATADSTTSSGEFTAALVTGTNTVSYTGDGYSGIYIWGAQLEAGAFPTSYIPTTTAQVTRSADAASMTGANFSSWYRADRGTVYSEAATYGTGSSAVFGLNDGTGANSLRVFRDTATGNCFLRSTTNNVLDVNLDSGFLSLNSPFKTAASYSFNNFTFSRSGGAVLSDTQALVPLTNQIAIGATVGAASILNGTIKKLAFYPERLSDAQLQALTS